jgi:hypothetical protein
VKFRLSIDRLTTGRIDVTLEVETTTRAERARWDADEAAKCRAGLAAIRAASASDAQAIAEEVLGS